MNSLEVATRDKLLTVRMTVEEMAQLDELSKLTRLRGSDLVRKLLQDELSRVKREEERERQRHERYWMRDKGRVRLMVQLARIPGLQASFDDEARTITITDGKRVEQPDSEMEAGIIIAGWPGSRIVAWSTGDFGTEHFGRPVVAKTKAAWEKAMNVKNPEKMTDEKWEKLGCEIVGLD